MTNSKYTTIAITRELKSKLDDKKIHRKDSYIDVIARLLKD